MPTAPVAYEAPARRRRSSYEETVCATLKMLGSSDPKADIAATGELLVNSQRAKMDPKAAAGIIYATARHRHPPTSVLASSEERRLLREVFDRAYPASEVAALRIKAEEALGVAEEQPCTKVTRDGIENTCPKTPIHSDKDLYKLLAPSMRKESQETFRVVCLDVHGDLVGDTEVARGQVSRVAVDVEDVMQAILAVKPRPTAFAISHVHPSGKVQPSEADKKLTEAIRKAASVAVPNIVFLDHIIIGGNTDRYFSFAEKKEKRG